MNEPADDNAAELRRRAEAAVAEMAEPVRPGAGSADTMHELLVHQAELEMQNEELRRLQASLETERARYFELFDLAPVGYVTLDAKNLIIEANLTLATQLGLPREKLSKLPFSRLIFPEDQDIFYLLRKKLSAGDAPLNCELRFLKPDGTSFWGRIEVSSSAGDKVGSCRISVTDINEKVKFREDLARREQEYRLLAENASDVVFRCSKTGIIEWIAPSVTARVGWETGDLVGRNFRDIVHPDDTDRLDAAQASLEDGIGFSVELRIRVHNDGYHWFSVSIRPSLDDAGKVTHLVG